MIGVVFASNNPNNPDIAKLKGYINEAGAPINSSSTNTSIDIQWNTASDIKFVALTPSPHSGNNIRQEHFYDQNGPIANRNKRILIKQFTVFLFNRAIDNFNISHRNRTEYNPRKLSSVQSNQIIGAFWMHIAG